jgi:CPA2 family monovalent cation:H+ antiporter-2
VDLNPENVRLAQAAGIPIYYGDISSPDVLDHVGIHRARALVVAINDSRAVERIIRVARQASNSIPILARTPYVDDIPSLTRAGASEIICAEVETAARLNVLLLKQLGFESTVLEECADGIRHNLSVPPAHPDPGKSDTAK